MFIKCDRRIFLRSVLGGTFLTAASSFRYKPSPKLAFATLGCPDWSFEEIVSNASRLGYDGIEFRGLQREFDLTKTKTFGSKQGIREAYQKAKDAGVKIICLGSSAVLHFSDPVLRKKNIDEAKRFVDLSHQLECPFVRVFADKYIDGKEKSQALIAQGLQEIADYGKHSNISVLLSTHGDVSEAKDVCDIMKMVEADNTGIGWDIVNTWYESRQPPAEVYKLIKKYIRIVHVKDMSFTGGKERNVLLGQGEVPVFEGIDALLKDGYHGYFSFVWEKRWYPEIEEPEVAFEDYIRVMKKYLSRR